MARLCHPYSTYAQVIVKYQVEMSGFRPLHVHMCARGGQQTCRGGAGNKRVQRGRGGQQTCKGARLARDVFTLICAALTDGQRVGSASVRITHISESKVPHHSTQFGTTSLSPCALHHTPVLTDSFVYVAICLTGSAYAAHLPEPWRRCRKAPQQNNAGESGETPELSRNGKHS